jgi:vitamin B12 transporter
MFTKRNCAGPRWLCALAVGLATGVAISAVPAVAQQRLPGIVISGGTLDPGKLDAEGGEGGNETPGLSTEKVGSAVTVITNQQLRDAHIQHAAEALRGLPGVEVSSTGGMSGISHVRIRGAEANHTLVLIDGIEANNTTTGDFDFSDLMTDDIERIEVIRGGYSGIYGSKAIGGVINIITKNGRGPITARAVVEGGSRNTRAGAVRLSGGTDKVWLSATAQYSQSDGFNIAPSGNEDDPWRNRTLGLKGGFRPLPGVQVDFSLRQMHRFLAFDQEGFNPLTGLNEAMDAPNTSTSDVLLGGAKVRWDLFDGAFTQILRTTYNRTDLDSSTVFGDTENINETRKFGYLATYRFGTPMLFAAKHSISGLLEKEIESFTPIASFTDGLERKRERLATVGEYKGEFLKRFYFAASVRHDNNDSFQDFTTWRTSISVPIKEHGIRPHASVGTSVALPGMFEQFGTILGTFVGNPDLMPEESFGWDAGIMFTLPDRKSTLDITYFNADLTNEIAGFGNSIINLDGKSERSGVEVAVKSQVLPWLFVGASYTYLDATDPDGNEEIRRPRHSGRVDLTTKFAEGRGRFNFSVIYNGAMKDQNFGTFPATVVTLNEYVLVNAAVTYKVQENVELFARVQNLFNEDYQEISGYETPPVSVYAGVRIKLVDPSTASWAKYQ